jgi:hypothetical protein
MSIAVSDTHSKNSTRQRISLNLHTLTTYSGLKISPLTLASHSDSNPARYGDVSSYVPRLARPMVTDQVVVFTGLTLRRCRLLHASAPPRAAVQWQAYQTSPAKNFQKSSPSRMSSHCDSHAKPYPRSRWNLRQIRGLPHLYAFVV